MTPCVPPNFPLGDVPNGCREETQTHVRCIDSNAKVFLKPRNNAVHAGGEFSRIFPPSLKTVPHPPPPPVNLIMYPSFLAIYSSCFCWLTNHWCFAGSLQTGARKCNYPAYRSPRLIPGIIIPQAAIIHDVCFKVRRCVHAHTGGRTVARKCSYPAYRSPRRISYSYQLLYRKPLSCTMRVSRRAEVFTRRLPVGDVEAAPVSFLHAWEGGRRRGTGVVPYFSGKPLRPVIRRVRACVYIFSQPR